MTKLVKFMDSIYQVPWVGEDEGVIRHSPADGNHFVAPQVM